MKELKWVNHDLYLKIRRLYPKATKIQSSDNKYKISKPGYRVIIQGPGQWLVYSIFEGYRSEKGGMKNNRVGSANTMDEALEVLKDRFDSFKAPEINRLDIQKRSFVKNDEKFRITQHGNAIRSIVQIKTITDVILVAIKDGSTKVYKVDENVPQENMAFLICCQNQFGATFDIITDSKTWYVSCDRSRRRLSNGSPKATVDISELREDDRQMIEFAVKNMELKFDGFKLEEF